MLTVQASSSASVCQRCWILDRSAQQHGGCHRLVAAGQIQVVVPLGRQVPARLAVRVIILQLVWMP